MLCKHPKRELDDQNKKTRESDAVILNDTRFDFVETV